MASSRPSTVIELDTLFFFFPGAMLAQLEACTTSYMKRFAQHLDTDSILN